MLKNRGKGSMNETILLIEDNESIIMGLEYLLTEEQYTFLAAKTKKEAQDLLASRQVDLVLLDVSLPDGNGFDLCGKIKEHDIAPVIFLTAKDEEKDVVLGFDLGADDYVTKPFQTGELAARVKSQLRRYQKFGVQDPAERTDEISLENLHIDKSLHAVEAFGKQVHLTHLEFEILYLLASHPGKVFSTDEIFERVWKEKSYDMSNTVMVHIRHLREKMSAPTGKSDFIKTVWGVGYKVEE